MRTKFYISKQFIIINHKKLFVYIEPINLKNCHNNGQTFASKILRRGHTHYELTQFAYLLFT